MTVTPPLAPRPGAIPAAQMTTWLSRATGLRADKFGRFPTRAAAQALGVSQRTIQRALRQGNAAGRGKLITALQATGTARPRIPKSTPPPRYSPEQVSQHLMRGYGPDPNARRLGMPDLQRASQETGVSVKRLEHLVRHGARTDTSAALSGIGTPWTDRQLAAQRASDQRGRQAFFQGLTGRPRADVTDTADTSAQGVRDKLTAAYGRVTSRDRAGWPTEVQIDEAEAAKDLEVTPGTIRRWTKNGVPNPDRSPAYQRLAQTASGADSSAAARAAALPSGQPKRMFSVAITGYQGPDYGPDYQSERTCAFNFLDPGDYAGLRDAYIARGAAGAQAWLQVNSGVYHDTWVIEDVTDIDIDFH